MLARGLMKQETLNGLEMMDSQGSPKQLHFKLVEELIGMIESRMILENIKRDVYVY